MYLPAFPTETEIDVAYPVLPDPHDCERLAALQRAERLGRIRELLAHISLTPLESAEVLDAGERSTLRAPARKDGVQD